MPTIETVAILITDLVGSTGLESRVGPAVADEFRRELFGLMREAIGETGGSEVKNTGDGLMVAFRSSSAAVDCAIAIQQRLAQRNRSSHEPLRIRIGVGMGDATVEENDYFGMPSIEAARLCDEASGDGILVTELVTMMARRAGEVFAPVGHLNLKGIPDPVAAFEVRWDRPDAREALPMPPGLTTRYRLPLVGRAGEQELLHAAAQAAAGGTGGVVFVSGEPGSGKTRLAGEAATRAHADGAIVLYGRCQADLGTPYQPLIEAMRHYLTLTPPSRLAPLREHSGILTRLAPDLAPALPEPDMPARRERRSAQRLITDATVAVLTAACRRAPTVLVIDDLHWARPPLLAVLSQLVHAAESLPLLLVAAYRDTEVGTDDPLSDLLVELRRRDGVERLSLPGLTEDGVAELLRASSADGAEPELGLVRELRRFTAGNPLVTGELVSEHAASGARLRVVVARAQPWDGGSAQLPEIVNEAIRARVAALSPAGRRVLEAGAVIGQDFDAQLVADIAGLRPEESLAALDETLAAGLVRAEGESIRRFSFVSAVVRHAVYADLTTPVRLTRHRAVAERIEAIDSERLVEIAEHWFAASALSGLGAHHLDVASDYAERAARRATEDGAFADAGRQYGHAAQLVAASSAGLRRRCELLLATGRSCARADQIPEAKEAFRGAAELARDLGDPELLALAALGYGLGPGDASYVVGVDEALVGLLEQALAGLEGDAGALRVRVLSRLAVELHLTGFVERREALSRQAVDLAESIGDRAAELVALYGWVVANWSPDELSGRLAGAEEIIHRATDAGETEMIHRGHAMKLRVLLEVGDMGAVDGEIAELERTAAAIGQPLYRWQAASTRAMRALHAGDAQTAEQWMHEALDVGSRADGEVARRSLDSQAALRHWLAGQPRDLIPILRRGVERCPWLPVRRARLAFGLAELRRRTEAVSEFERLAQDGFAHLPRDGNWLLTMGFLSYACAFLGDVTRAAMLKSALEPYAERFLVSGDATTTWGPASTALAVLEATVGRYDEAADRFDRALEQCAATGAEGQGVFAAREYARMLLLRGRTGDQAHAARLLRDATSTAQRRGLPGLADQVKALAAAAEGG